MPSIIYVQDGPKNVSSKLLFISSPNTDRFFKFFHPHILWKIYDKVATKYNLNCLNHTLTASLHFSNHSITKFYTESDGEKKI